MYSRMDKYHGQKVQRFSIRKYSFGAASVAVAAYMMFGGAATVHADVTPSTTPATNEQVNPNAGNQADSSKPVASTETSTSTVVAPATEQLATPAPEVEPAETPKADTSKLEAAIARIEAALGKAGLTEKTASAIEAAKAELAKAQALLSNDKATQAEVDYSTSSLKNRAFVLESMPKASTDKKENKNQDPRNGQAIPGQGESGFREAAGTPSGTTNTTVTNDVITPTNPAQPTAKDIIGSTSTVSRENFTGWDTYTMPFGSSHPGQGDLGVNTPEKKRDAADLEFRVFSDQRAGTRLSPGPSNWTYEGKASDIKARIDYGLKLPAKEVQKIIEEAELWRGKMRYNGSLIQSAPASTYYGSGPYEYLLSSIYKLGYEQGIDKVYIKDVRKRIEVTEAAKNAGWTVSDFNVFNFPNGLFYDKATDSVQGVVTHRSPFNYQQVKARVTFKNTITGKSVTIPLDDHRFAGTAWKDGTPPTLEINEAIKEGKVGEALTVPVEYKDAGASHAGVPNDRSVTYNLTDENGTPIGRTTTIKETVGRAILGVSGANITGTIGGKDAEIPTELTGNETKIPGVGFTIASADMTENNPNGFKGTPTEAGIYRVSIYARDYRETNANEAYAHATFKIAPEVTVKNVHAYDTEVPITISRGASEATITLPDGTNTKIVAKDGKWVVSETTNTAVNVNDEIGTVGETFNLKVLPTATANAATDTINVTANSENITATFTRAEVTLKTQLGENVAATFNKTSGRWELSGETAEKKTPNSDGTTTWLKRDLYVDVNKDGETIFNVYEYTRTLNAEGKVTAVNNVSRTLTTYKKENTANSSADSATDTNKGMVVTVRYDKGLNKWTADDNSTVTATKTGDKWTISTTSGFSGTIDAVETASSSDKASVLNDAPSISSTSYTTVKGATVDLVKQKSAAVTITDIEDDATTAPNKKETTVTKVTLTSPSGTVTEYSSAAEAATVKLSEVGTYTVKVEVKDSNGNIVTADTETDTGTNKGAETAVNSTTYTITVKDQEANKLYTVEGDTVTNNQLKEKVVPTEVDGFTATKNDIADIPTTAKKAGQTLEVPATVTYTKGTETIPVETKVDVVVLPKVEPKGVTVLKDSTGLDEAVKAKAVEAANAVPTNKLPDGVTVRVKEVKAGTVPATTATGVQTPATAVVEYVKDGKVVETREVPVPVTVVGSTAKKLVVFEGDTVTKDDVKGAVTAGTDGTKGEPVIAEDITAKAGNKEVPVPVTYDGIKDPETVTVPVTVLPKPEAEEILVAKNSDKEKAKEKVLAKAKKAIEDATFTGKLPQGATVEIDNTVPVTVPDLTEDTEVDVPVKYTVPGQDTPLTTTVKVPVTVVEGVPQIVPVDENNKQPNPENSIDKTEYPEGSTFKYDPKSPVDTTTPGDYTVNVIVKDKDGNPIAEVPATVRVVESYPQFVPVDKDNKQPTVEGSIDPKAFPKDTEFTYESPVDTTTPGEKDVVVVAKIGDKVITKVPAKVMVVEPKTQYVPVDKSNKQPDASKSVDPEQYPDGVTFKYKTPVDTTTPGEKDVIVEAKDGEDKLVEVPAKVKVVEGKEQLIPVNPTEKPQARDSITPSDYPEGSTFEYKVPEGQKEPFDATTVGDKPVTVVVKDKNGNVLVEVPATIKVVEAKPTPIETPVTNTPLTKEDIAKFVKVPEGGKVTNVENIPDLTTPGEKDPVKVTVELPNGKVITVDVPVNVTPVNEIETPVTNTPLTPEDYTKGITIPEGGKVTNVENIPDLTTPGKKDPVKVTVELPNGKVITVDIPVNVTPVKEIETPVTNTPLTPEDYTKGIKIPEGGKVTNVENIPDLTTPGKKDPVKVTVELPNGKTITVDVPVNVTPVKEIETPVTNTPLTPEDYTKGIKIPEGGKVTNVENIPDLTTPGKKDPVKVTVELPNGKTITVDVPVNVTPVKEIETPVTNTPLTPEDYTKGIKIPEGGKVTNVENIPDLTTPGKKDPVKVTVELPNGKVITVEVPVNVTPVKEIETPVTSTPLTPEDYTKGIKIPEGGKVTNVENIPDLTTPGKKDPVKVTITLPNGKVVTVEVPVNVTPITPIETPITKEKLTPEDVLKQIKIPEGATVKVGDLPDLTTPGKKDPVKVTITLPNGKIVTVEVPVNVTPIEDIVKKQGDPITAEDVEKHIPKGVKVISIGDKPTTDIPGERPSIPVVIELPNGIRVTMDIPVIVTPKVTPVVVPVGTPVTPEDVKKHIELPKGWTVTKVGEIPTTTTPGTKPVVPVEIELPDGRKITVDVPVIVTPTVRQIVVPQGTPITPDDVKGHIDLPKEPGWEIVEVGEIPTTIPAGVKPSVKVKIKVPTGEIIEVDVPVIVTPKVTPIVVEVGTPITKEDVMKKVDLPEGWEIVEVGEIPTTETPGTKPVVKVKVKLPDGRIITVDVPVTVTPKSQNGGGVISQNGDSTVQIVTEYLDENGNRITSDKEGKHNPIELEGYEFSHSTTDAKGNTLHHYKKVKKPINQEQPSSPETPTSPEKPVATPVQTSSTDSKQVSVETTVANDKKELPNTGTEDKAGLASLGLLGMLGAFGLVARKKKED